eukprot:gb/GECG01001364.1/.p1 GENE.gb/GECG01001364.1/~~gb/GECG01001364.1/.p1  ORF type:complete len:242 (+),score=23.30 gb/GECG01001364.1/:1-726(+)
MQPILPTLSLIIRISSGMGVWRISRGHSKGCLVDDGVEPPPEPPPAPPPWGGPLLGLSVLSIMPTTAKKSTKKANSGVRDETDSLAYAKISAMVEVVQESIAKRAASMKDKNTLVRIQIQQPTQKVSFITLNEYALVNGFSTSSTTISKDDSSTTLTRIAKDVPSTKDKNAMVRIQIQQPTQKVSFITLNEYAPVNESLTSSTTISKDVSSMNDPDTIVSFQLGNLGLSEKFLVYFFPQSL